jgi:hypothetical protein
MTHSFGPVSCCVISLVSRQLLASSCVAAGSPHWLARLRVPPYRRLFLTLLCPVACLCRCPPPPVLCLLQARQLSELLDFAEQERLTLLEREASLQQELEQVGLGLS